MEEVLLKMSDKKNLIKQNNDPFSQCYTCSIFANQVVPNLQAYDNKDIKKKSVSEKPSKNKQKPHRDNKGTYKKISNNGFIKTSTVPLTISAIIISFITLSYFFSPILFSLSGFNAELYIIIGMLLITLRHFLLFLKKKPIFKIPLLVTSLMWFFISLSYSLPNKITFVSLFIVEQILFMEFELIFYFLEKHISKKTLLILFFTIAFIWFSYFIPSLLPPNAYLIKNYIIIGICLFVGLEIIFLFLQGYVSKPFKVMFLGLGLLLKDWTFCWEKLSPIFHKIGEKLTFLKSKIVKKSFKYFCLITCLVILALSTSKIQGSINFYPLSILIPLAVITFISLTYLRRNIRFKEHKTKIAHKFRGLSNNIWVIRLEIVLILLLIFSICWLAGSFLFNNNLIALGVDFLLIFILFILFIPNSKRKPEKVLDYEKGLPAKRIKNYRRHIKKEHTIIDNYDDEIHDKGLKISAFLLISFLIFLPFAITSFSITLDKAECPTPSFGLVPQTIRKSGEGYDPSVFEYFENPNDLEEITFNSLLVLKFELSVKSSKDLSIIADLIPKAKKGVIKTSNSIGIVESHTINLGTFKGRLSNKIVFTKLDLDKLDPSIVPGEYTLRIYSIQQQWLSMARTSSSHLFNITLSKDRVYFNPNYERSAFNYPSDHTARGSIYSLQNEDVLSWDNYFDTRMEDSLGRPISGEVSLYLTQRQGFRPVFTKIYDYNVKKDGVISYTNVTYSHYRQYMQGKIFFDGSQSLFYGTTTHIEDCEIAENSFLHTSRYPDRPEYTYNGTNFNEYNKNDFRMTSHLFYFHEFNINELQWTKSPAFIFDSGPPDLIYLTVDDSLNSYIESPQITYLGTIADIATFTYSFDLVKVINGGEDIDEIWVDVTTQVYRDTQLVFESLDYSDYYNDGDFNWKTINLDLTENFTEGGQTFRIKIKVDFTFDPSCDDEIILKFDYAKLEAFHPPTYYRGFNFESGFNEFASPSMGTGESFFYDADHPITVGNDILSYLDYSGLITNNYFNQDFSGQSWDAFSGLFSVDEYGNLVFTQDDGINMPPIWNEINDNGLAIFDLQGSTSGSEISDSYQSEIKDEFTSIDDSDDALVEIRQKYASPKIVAINEFIIIVFTGRYSGDDMWKIYLTYASRNGEFSTSTRVYDPGDDAIYQLAPSIVLSPTDLYITWQQRNRDTHPYGETEWTIMYGRISLSDFILKSVMNVTTYNPSNLDSRAMMVPDIALTPLGNIYNEAGTLLHADCMVHVSYEDALWINPTPGSRSNEDVDDIDKTLYYTRLNSSYISSSFSSPVPVSDIFGEGNGISHNGDLETPLIRYQLCYNTTAISEDSTQILINFDQSNDNRVFQINSISIIDSSNQTLLLYSSEEDFVKMFGNQSILFYQNKIVLPDDLQFHDVYDNRTYDYGVALYINNTSEYPLSSIIPDNITLVKNVKDVYVSNIFFSDFEIELLGQRLDRSNWSIEGIYGTEDLSITFNPELSAGQFFYVKYSLDDYSLPSDFIVDVSTIKNEVSLVFERYLNNSNTDVYLDISNNNFEFQDDLLISNNGLDMNHSKSPYLKYDFQNRLLLIYSRIVNSSCTDLFYKLYNSTSTQFEIQKVISESIDFTDYDYYRMLNPVIDFSFNGSLFIAYDTSYRELGDNQKWKIRYLYYDPVQDQFTGPFYIKEGTSTQERNPNCIWDNGLFVVYSVNSSNSWTVEFTTSPRADLVSFSTLAADFIPVVYNDEAFRANMSIYFNIDLKEFQNTDLESEDQIRFIVTIDSNDNQYILLDTDWNSQELLTWIQNNIGQYYPRYLRYYYNLSMDSLTYSEIYDADENVQNNIYPFELKFPYPIAFSDHYELRFNLVKNQWSINSSEDVDQYQLGIDNIDLSFEMVLADSDVAQPDDFTFTKGGFISTGDLRYIDNSTSIITPDTTSGQGGHEMPVSNDFSFSHGSLGAYNDLEDDDAVETRIDAGVTWGSESYLGYIEPMGDIYTQWADGDSPPHWSKLDEATGDMNGDGGNIREYGWSGANEKDRFEMTTLTIPAGHRVTKMIYYGYVKRQSSSITAYISIDSSFSTSGFWSPDGTSYVWKSYTLSGLDKGQTDLNNFWFQVIPANMPVQFGGINGWVDIETVYVEVYTTPKTYKIDTTVAWNVEDISIWSMDYLRFDYSSTVYHSFYIWDYTLNGGAGGWEFIPSPSSPITLQSKYYDSSNRVKVRFLTASRVDDFDLYIDQLRIDYTDKYIVDATVEWTVLYPKDFSTYYLFFDHSISVPLDFYIWDWNSSSWDKIISDSYFMVSTIYLSQNYTVKVRYLVESSTDFELELDMLKLEHIFGKFGVLARSGESNTYAQAEFLVSRKLESNDLEFLSDPNYIDSANNMVDLIIDFYAYSVLYDNLPEIIAPPSSHLECEMMVMVETNSNPDLTISDEISYDSWTGYDLKDLRLNKIWGKSFGTLNYYLDLETFKIIISDKDEYFTLSNSEERALFSTFKTLFEDGQEEIYIVFNFKVNTFDLNQYEIQNGINLIFNEFKFPIEWQRTNGSHSQTITLYEGVDPFMYFEKVSKPSNLDLISNFGIQVDGRDDLVALSSLSQGYIPAGTEDNYQYYIPANSKNITNTAPADYLNFINIHLYDCVGLYDSSNNLLVDGANLKGKSGLVSPNLNSNETCSYSLRSILDVYPFFNYRNGSDIDKSFSEFKSELMKLKVEIYDQFNVKIFSGYSDTLIRMQNFDINDFTYTTNDDGERFYYMEDPLRVYIYGDDIVTSTDYVSLKLSVEFFDTYYMTVENTFRNLWGVFLDNAKFEFIQNDILPEFMNVESFDFLSDEVEIIVRAFGDDYEWACLLYNYKNMGPYFFGYDLIANLSSFELIDDYATFNFTWDTSELEDDSIYELMVLLQNNKGIRGNSSLTNITVINTPPNITFVAKKLTEEGWKPIYNGESVLDYVKLTTLNNVPTKPLTKVIYYFYNETPSEQNRENWTKISEIGSNSQNYDYILHSESLPNGSWYFIADAFNGGPMDTYQGFENKTVVDKYLNNIKINDVVSLQDDVSLDVSEETESQISYAKFYAIEQGTQDKILLDNDTYAPFSAPLSNLGWTTTTVFDIFIELKLYNVYLGCLYLNLSKTDITLDLTGPSIDIDSNSDDILYQISQAGGSWTTPTDFDGIINGTITSGDSDFHSFRLSYDYGSGFIDDSRLYNSNEVLQWNVKFIPDNNISLKIFGFDDMGNPSAPIELSFINDMNTFDELFVEGYSFGRIYNIFEPTNFKILPTAQDIESITMTCGSSSYEFIRHDPQGERIYFDRDILFDVEDFNFNGQNVDTKILEIIALDVSSHEVELDLPYTASLGLNTDLTINNFIIESNKDILYSETFENSSKWELVGVSEEVMNIDAVLQEDAYIRSANPDINYHYVPCWYTMDIAGGPEGPYTNSLIKYEYPYLDLNYTSNSTLKAYVTFDFYLNGYACIYHTNNFSESTVTWNNQPSTGDYQQEFDISGRNIWIEEDIGAPNYYYKIISKDDVGRVFSFAAKDIWYNSSIHPRIIHYFSKIYQGNGIVYMQTNTTEMLTLRSPDNLNLELLKHDTIEITLNTTCSNQIDLNLLNKDTIVDSFALTNYGNQDFTTKTVRFNVSNDILIDQLEFSGVFHDAQNLIINNITIYRSRYPHNSIIFNESSNIYIDINSEYDNPDGIPYYSNVPKVKFNGLNLGNEYEFNFMPNINSENIANLTLQTSRSNNGEKILRINNKSQGICEITRIFIDSDYDLIYDTILESDQLFYYFSTTSDNRSLFLHYNDEFVEEHVIPYYQVAIEYKFSDSAVLLPFVLNYDIGDLVSDIYDIEVNAYDIHGRLVTKTFQGMVVDDDGPHILPLFNNNTRLNCTSGQITFQLIDPSKVDSVELQINDNGWRIFNGEIENIENTWIFKFNESTLDGIYNIKLIANDTLGYSSILDTYYINFDSTKLGFFPDLYDETYLFYGSGLIHVLNSTENLFNKTVKSLHVYVNSSLDFGYFYDLPLNFNGLILDSMILPDGEHILFFEYVDIADNKFTFSYLIYVDNSPPSIIDLPIFDKEMDEEIYFNNHVDLNLALSDISEISSVTLYVTKILGVPSIYKEVGISKEWANIQMRRLSRNGTTYYLTPDNLVYSFYDGWINDTTFEYENVIYWDGEIIPFIDLNIYDIEDVISSGGISVPFFFDNIKQEITFDERYRGYLTDNLTLIGVKCDFGWNTPLSLNGQVWSLTNFDVADYVNTGADWWPNLLGFDNDDGIYDLHFDYLQKYTRDRFEFYFEVKDIHNNTVLTNNFKGKYDPFPAKGSFGQVSINAQGETKNNYWELGKTAEAGNILFGSTNSEHRTVYFSPGYLYNSSSSSYYVEYGCLFLHNIKQIKLYNASNFYLGDMILDPTTLPYPYYYFELESLHFSKGLTQIKAEIIDYADNVNTIFQNIYVFKEGPYSLYNSTNFGDIIYHYKERNYTEDPYMFYGYLDSWISHENKSDIQVDMSYFDFSEQIWVPLGTSLTSDGVFIVDWHMTNNTYHKLLSIQRGYIPVNITFNDQPNNYFYGSYGYFDDDFIHPFLIDLNGNVYVYSYDISTHQWFINYTIPLGFSLTNHVISDIDLDFDGKTDLVIFNKKSSADNISFYIFDESSLQFTFNQTIDPLDINYPETVTNPMFTEYFVDIEVPQSLSMYICVYDSSSGANYLAKFEFNSFLAKTQIPSTAVQLPADRTVLTISRIEDRIYVGQAYQGLSHSSIIAYDKDLSEDSFEVFENSIKGKVVRLESLLSEIGIIVVVGISMESYSEDDQVLYYAFEHTTSTWYKTSFSFETESDMYEFRIREIIKSSDNYFDSAIIASSKGIYKTSITTDVISLDTIPIFFAVDTFRKWDLYEYQVEGDSDHSLIPLSHYPIEEIINVYEFDREHQSYAYVYDLLEEIEPSSYSISSDERHLLCHSDGWNWGPKNPSDADIYYEVRYFYRATLAEDSGLLSSQYKKEEYESVGNVVAMNTNTRAYNLGFLLKNPYDDFWSFNYGTQYNDYNYLHTDMTSGVPYYFSKGIFDGSLLSSGTDLSSLTEYGNLRMNYYPIEFETNMVSAGANLSQFATGQDFYSSNYQNLYSNSYIDSVWVENLGYSSSIDFSTDMLDYDAITSDYGSLLAEINPDLADSIAYKPNISEVSIYDSALQTPSYDLEQGYELIETLTDQDHLLRVYEEDEGNADRDIYIDVTFTLDHNEDSQSIKYILVSTAFAHRIDAESGYDQGHFVRYDDNINFALLSDGDIEKYFKDIYGFSNFNATNIRCSDSDDKYRKFKTYNFGESIYSDSNYLPQYYKVDNTPSKANFLYPSIYAQHSIDKGVFTKEDDNRFRFYHFYYDEPRLFEKEDWNYEEHIYDYNYLRLDTSNIQNTFTDDGKLTLRIILEGYEGSTSKIDRSELILRQFQCVVISDKDNLNNNDWDLIDGGNAKKGENDGVLLNSGAIKLNPEPTLITSGVSKEPDILHNFIETSYGNIYIVDSSDPKVLLKSNNLGQSWQTISTRDTEIKFNWYDRSSEKIYFIEQDGNIFSVDLEDDSITEENDVGYPWDMFMIGNDLYYMTYLGLAIPPKTYAVIEKVGGSSYSHYMGDQTGRELDSSQVCVVGSKVYWLFQWSDENVELWCYDNSDHSFTQLREVYPGMNPPPVPGTKLPDRLHGAITYDGANILSFAVNVTLCDDRYFIYTYDILENYLEIPQIGNEERWKNIALMLDRNTDNDVFEKAFHLSLDDIYQIDLNKQLNLLHSLNLEGSIIAISDNYFLTDNGELYKFSDSYPMKGYLNTREDSKYRALFRLRGTSPYSTSIGFKVGNSGKHIIDIEQSNVDYVIEITYDTSNSWKFYINGEEDASFNPSLFDNGITSLYPIISLEEQGDIEIFEIKNQLFEKFGHDDYNNDFNFSIPSGDGYNDLTYSDISLDREILYVFNENFNNIPAVFDDLYLWSDLEFSTNLAGSQRQYDQNFPIFNWNPPHGQGVTTIRPTDINDDGIINSIYYEEPEDTGYSRYQLIYSDDDYHIGVMGLYDIYFVFEDFAPSLPDDNIYILKIEPDYNFRYKFSDSISADYLRLRIYFTDGNAYFDFPTPHKPHGEYEVVYNGANEDLNDYEFTHDRYTGYLNDAFIYTDSLDITEASLRIKGDSILYLEVDKFGLNVITTDEPNTFEDYFYSQTFDIPNKELNEF